MFSLIAMGREQIAAVAGAINRDFAFGAATNCANQFAFGGTEASGFSFATDGTYGICGHEFSKNLGYEMTSGGANRQIAAGTALKKEPAEFAGP